MSSVLLLLELLGTIDYMTADGSVIFRTCEKEKDRLVFQMVRNALLCLLDFLISLFFDLHSREVLVFGSAWFCMVASLV